MDRERLRLIDGWLVGADVTACHIVADYCEERGEEKHAKWWRLVPMVAEACESAWANESARYASPDGEVWFSAIRHNDDVIGSWYVRGEWINHDYTIEHYSLERQTYTLAWLAWNMVDKLDSMTEKVMA